MENAVKKVRMLFARFKRYIDCFLTSANLKNDVQPYSQIKCKICVSKLLTNLFLIYCVSKNIALNISV